MTEEEKNEKKDIPDEPERLESPEEISDTAENKESEDSPETVPDTSETESLRAENIRLKAQIEAYKIGFRSETLEDAVLLAENISERAGVEISEALQSVAEKYPDWKNTENNSGFKVGAEFPSEDKPDENRLDNAFGIRKKK